MNPADLIDVETWDVQGTAAFVQLNSFQRVALQLPDNLLKFSPSLVEALMARLGPGHTVGKGTSKVRKYHYH